MSDRPNLIFLCKAQFKWIQHCWSTTPNIVGCYVLLHVAGSCCAKLETGQSFEPTTPNISFVLSADRWSEMQQCWMGPCIRITHGLQSLKGCILLSMDCMSQCCCMHLHTTANTDTTTCNFVGPAMLTVVVSVCT